MSPKRFILFAYLILSGTTVNAQNIICGFDGIQQRLKKDNGYAERAALAESRIRQKVTELATFRKAMRNMSISSAPLYEIPVVVHIIYRSGDANPGAPSNPTDTQIQAAIDRLNANFSAAPGSGNEGAGTPIKFALAKRSPGCGSTTGIERLNGGTLNDYDASGMSYPGSGSPGAAETAVKNLSTWPEKQYYNIWVVWKINAVTPGSSSIAGYASLPYAGNDYHIYPAEGMVILSRHMNDMTPTLTHEMGHAFGLFHTFEGSDAGCPENTNCSTDGDRVCDTDPVKDLSGPCPASTDINLCTKTAYGTIQNNLMGYGSCLNRFTQGQSDRMMAALLAIRSGLLTSQATIPPPSIPVKAAVQVPVNILRSTNTSNAGPCNVTLGNMSYVSYGYNQDGYRSYSDNSCTIGEALHVAPGQVLSVTTQTNPQACKAWIDFNNDGQFNDDELVLNSQSDVAAYTHTATIPPDQLSTAVKSVPLRMRVMADLLANPDFTAGSQLLYGQTEDFWVSIEEAAPLDMQEISALLKNNTLKVQWSTTHEANIGHFIIEASADSQNFIPLTRVDSKAKDGFSNSLLQYSVTFERNGKLAMGLGLLTLLFSLRSFGRYKKRRWLIAPLVICLFITCNKQPATEPRQEETIRFIRVTGVDRNGIQQYIKAIKIVNG
ncbi:M43 family zinc metalloprotease [Niabella drilacis]|uniref:Pregnancy-associated plasma protein-A n=1 Tax=Niabella drilacis (strain DSM 25811 / CCM 8410 / CCUG 62505 / LMG 26954 / E90) TaxID=1285928 RepID=A0A1G6KUF8_NIADE|nr:M43 family zinc metalloprotease [Niabella drilacis]SDC34421.1 Pregnancy-associated plasma protein-A [Niabella drilacis]